MYVIMNLRQRPVNACRQESVWGINRTNGVKFKHSYGHGSWTGLEDNICKVHRSFHVSFRPDLVWDIHILPLLSDSMISLYLGQSLFTTCRRQDKRATIGYSRCFERKPFPFVTQKTKRLLTYFWCDAESLLSDDNLTTCAINSIHISGNRVYAHGLGDPSESAIRKRDYFS